ncbi:MAG: hypothetical protein V4671_20710 [Armatimonadota bacterium]
MFSPLRPAGALQVAPGKAFAATLLSVAVLTSAVWAQQTARLKINGRTVPGQPLSVKGKTYIPLDALKAAGVVVKTSPGTMELTLSSLPSTAAGGANQQGGLEGKMGDWLFNGVWRFRVISVEKAPASLGEGWAARVEIRNGSKFSGYSPGGTGWQGISLVTEDGMSVGAASDAVDLQSQGLAQGAANTQTVFFATESASKPARIVLRFDSNGVANTPLRYSVSNPSFRVDVRSAAGSSTP